VKLFNFCKKVYGEFGEDKGGVLCAAFAYFAIFALGPLLLVLISIIGFVYGEKAASGQLFSSLNDIVGPSAAKSIQSAVAHAHQSGGGAIALIIGMVGTVLAAVGLSNQLQNSFDVIFRAVPDPKASIKRTIYTKFKNLTLLLSTGLVVIVSVVLSAVVSAVGHRLHEHFGIPAAAVEALNTGVSLLIFVAILYLIYKVLPDVHIPGKITLAAAAVVSLLFIIGKVVLGIIIGRNATASAYGAAASLIVLLLWFYYTAEILLLGAEGIKVYAKNHAIILKPKKYTLGRKSLNVDTSNEFILKLVDAFNRGFSSKKTKK
jgi:membrane protein